MYNCERARHARPMACTCVAPMRISTVRTPPHNNAHHAPTRRMGFPWRNCVRGRPVRHRALLRHPPADATCACMCQHSSRLDFGGEDALSPCECEDVPNELVAPSVQCNAHRMCIASAIICTLLQYSWVRRQVDRVAVLNLFQYDRDHSLLIRISSHLSFHPAGWRCRLKTSAAARSRERWPPGDAAESRRCSSTHRSRRIRRWHIAHADRRRPRRHARRSPFALRARAGGRDPGGG